MGWDAYPLDGTLGEYRGRWDTLNGELFGANPYFDSRFIEPLLRHFGVGNERLCVHRHGGQIDCMLVVVPGRLGKWSLFLPGQGQIAPILGARADLLRSLLPRLSWRALALDAVSQDPQCSPLANPGELSVMLVDHIRTISVRLDSSFEEYWRARSGRLRQNTSRRVRRVQDAGFQLRTRHYGAREEMGPAVQRFGELESLGWKGKSGTAVHIDNIQGRFYAEMMAAFAATGQASIYELYFNDALVAMQLAIASPAMVVLLKTTYDESHATLSPGRLLLYEVLKEEFNRRRARTVEFYTNADSDQAAWATDERWIRHCVLFRNGLARRLYRLRERSRARAATASGGVQPES